MNVKRVLENSVENELVKRVKAIGGRAEKVIALGRRGFFDRLVVLPGGRIIFVECKRPRGGIVSPNQILLHDAYRKLGVVIAIVRNSEDIDQLIGHLEK
jgi:hypothetical protein